MNPIEPGQNRSARQLCNIISWGDDVIQITWLHGIMFGVGVNKVIGSVDLFLGIIAISYKWGDCDE